MKRVFNYLLTLLVLCGTVRAREATNAPAESRLQEYMETGMEVSGLRAPYYDEKGNLKAQLYGGHARIIDEHTADVTNIRIDAFEHGKVVMTLYAPHCITRVIDKGKEKVLSVESAGDVLIEMKQMTISGHGFRFSSDSNRFEILGNSKVLVKESARTMKGVNL